MPKSRKLSAQQIRDRNRDFQRAYRLRQSLTISVLSRKVNALEDAVERMSLAMLGLVDHLAAATHTSKAPARILELCRKGLDGALQVAKELATIDPDYRTSQMHDEMACIDQNPDCETADKQSLTSSTLGTDMRLSVCNRPKVKSRSERIADQMDWTASSGHEHPVFHSIPDEHMDGELKMQQHVTFVHTYPVYVSISCPSTYSHLEKVFSRRLQRASLEYGVRLLDNSDSSSLAAPFTFRLSSSYLSPILIRRGILELLSRPVTDSMDNHSSPVLTLGGAGTLFPRLDVPGTPKMDSTGWIRRAFQRHCLHPMAVGDPQLGFDVQLLEKTITRQGLEGEWLDANDVEVYLRQVKGLLLDQGSNFVHVVSTRPQVGRGTTTVHLKTPRMADYVALPYFNFDALKEAQEHRYPHFHYGNISISSKQPGVRPKVDVTKLVDNLVHKSTCIGRCPGFRRYDVDAALQQCLILP